MSGNTKSRAESVLLRCLLASLLVWAGCTCDCDGDYSPSDCELLYRRTIAVFNPNCVCNVTYEEITGTHVTADDMCIPEGATQVTVKVHGRAYINKNIKGDIVYSCHLDGGTASCH